MALSVGASNLVIPCAKEVPAILPLIPEFAIIPTAVAMSSKEAPASAVMDAEYFIVSPNSSTFVLDLLIV